MLKFSFLLEPVWKRFGQSLTIQQFEKRKNLFSTASVRFFLRFKLLQFFFANSGLTDIKGHSLAKKHFQKYFLH